GDEVVVLARGIEPARLEDTTRLLASRLSQKGELLIRFSVGHSFLTADGNPDDALREADQAMYRNKDEGPRLRLRRA
ncbi:MAG: hypothetical protein ABI837_11395, partial [Acidobacteriota bacterium]